MFRFSGRERSSMMSVQTLRSEPISSFEIVCSVETSDQFLQPEDSVRRFLIRVDVIRSFVPRLPSILHNIAAFNRLALRRVSTARCAQPASVPDQVERPRKLLWSSLGLYPGLLLAWTTP